MSDATTTSPLAGRIVRTAAGFSSIHWNDLPGERRLAIDQVHVVDVDEADLDVISHVHFNWLRLFKHPRHVRACGP